MPEEQRRSLLKVVWTLIVLVLVFMVYMAWFLTENYINTAGLVVLLVLFSTFPFHSAKDGYIDTMIWGIFFGLVFYYFLYLPQDLDWSSAMFFPKLTIFYVLGFIVGTMTMKLFVIGLKTVLHNLGISLER